MTFVRAGLIGLIAVVALAGGVNWAAQAQDEISYGDTVQTTLQPDVEYVWTFQGSAGDRVIIEFTTDGEHVLIDLRDPAGWSIGWQWGHAVGDEEYGSVKTGVRLPADGRYSISVEHVSAETAADFTMTVNRVADMGLPVVQYDEVVEFRLAPDETRYFVVQPVAGDLVQVRLSGVGDVANELYVGGEADLGQETLEGCSYPINGFSSVDGQSITYRECQVISTGNELVIAAELMNVGDNSASQPVALVVEQVPMQPIESGMTVEGELLPGAEQHFTFDGAAGETVTVRLESEAFVPEVLVENEYGTGYGMFDASFGSGENTVAVLENFAIPEADSFTPAQATYHIVVRESDFSDPKVGGAFSLTFERVQ
ncbi:MAG: hypothetical protein GYB65_06055 [Chloroflexi bacterium]|nr:hypothetical protein [Chloroflexota bacterium]